MFVIVGLGNPGKEYNGTRHNVGRDILLDVIEQNGLATPVRSNRYAGLVSEGMLEGTEVSFLLPETYMNNSGASVKKVITGKNMNQKLVVVHDDIDLPIGTARISSGRGTGGHNGIASIVRALGTKDFIRIRIGIAQKSFFGGKARRPPAGAPMTKHVLSTFTKKELRALEPVTGYVEAALKTIIKDGVEQAMNTFN